MRSKLIAANWKMNGSFALIDAIQKVLSPLLEETTCEIVICPPDVLLYSMKNAVKEPESQLVRKMFTRKQQGPIQVKHPHRYYRNVEFSGV